MIGLTAVLAVVASSPRPANEIFAPVRVDCTVSSTRKFGANFKQTEPYGTSSYVFLFPYEAQPGSEAPYIVTQDDGRSWLRRTKIARLEANGWPSFFAVLGQGADEIRLESDATVKGRVNFKDFPDLLTDGGGAVESSGTCTITIDPDRVPGK